MPFFSRLNQRGSRGPSPAPRAERRLWVRYPCDLATDCVHPGRSAERRSAAVVTDLSRGGCRLTLAEAAEPGDLLSLEVPGDETATLLALVVRVARRRDGRWDVG